MAYEAPQKKSLDTSGGSAKARGKCYGQNHDHAKQNLAEAILGIKVPVAESLRSWGGVVAPGKAAGAGMTVVASARISVSVLTNINRTRGSGVMRGLCAGTQ